MSSIKPSITTWQRLIPISRSSDFETAIAAEIRDPMWMLARQHQVGELRGEDTGSPAFVRVAYRSVPLDDITLASSDDPTNPQSVTVPVDPTRPIEAQILPEPFAPDLATRVEVGLTFFQIVDEAFGAGAGAVKQAFTTADLQLPAPTSDPAAFDPLDDATAVFALMTVGRAVDGIAIYGLAKAGTVPPGVAAGDRPTLLSVYTAFVRWVEGTFGAVGTSDPSGWNPSRLDYDIKLRFGGSNAVTVGVHPNENGSVDWTSFDVESVPASDPFAAGDAQVAREIPAHVRFPGMPAPRYWDFESGDLPLPDVDAGRAELARLLVVDFAMLYGVDFFVAPLELDVARAATIDSLIVYDVFGGRTAVDPVEAGRSLSPPDRFTMYGAAAPNGGVGNFMVLAPAGGGRALHHGPALEEVRFARDEAADMAFGIEAVTESRIGEPRRGTEREAAVAAASSEPAPPPTDAPLRYQIETRVPVYWIPFLVPNTGGAPTTDLEKGTTVRAANGSLLPVPSAGKILNPKGAVDYRVHDEEISRSGTRVERLVFGARGRDGSSFLWVARRRRAGNGETESGLRFDSALSTQT